MATAQMGYGGGGVGLRRVKLEEVDCSEGEEDCVALEDLGEDEEPYMGQGLFALGDFEGDDEVPDRDPLMDYDDEEEEVEIYEVEPVVEEENNENVDMKPLNVLPVEEIQKAVLLITQVTGSEVTIEVEECQPENQQSPLVITSVESLREESVAGTNASKCKAAVFPNLDVFRCFLCRRDYQTFDDFLIHRTKSRQHEKIPYDAEAEKAFSCGICQRPWNQPRKALACAVFGHDPAKIYESMFIHSCPLCPEAQMGFHSLAAVGKHWSTVHPEKMLPAFLYKSCGKDQLPCIKVSLYETSLVSESMMKDNRDLVLENFASSASEGSPKSASNSNHLKVYRCSECKRNFETRREVEIHQCSRLAKHILVPTPIPRRYICDDCGKEFPNGRNFRMHLLRAGVCKKEDGVMNEDCPYKCIFCCGRYNSFKAYMCHRVKAHVGVPYNPALELPYACKICQKPAFVQKEAMICALFGHDPTYLRKAMFKYKCPNCLSFGFHSLFALKRHWELEHPNAQVPPSLQSVTVDKPLPCVYITLEQLLSFKKLQKLGSGLVIERELHPSLTKYATFKSNGPTGRITEEVTLDSEGEEADQTLVKMMQSKPTVEVAYVPLGKNIGQEIVRRSLLEESVLKGECVICKKYFKDIRRHFKIHDQTRFSGAPMHKCVCGKEYHLRNSLHSHWKKNKVCKMKYQGTVKEKEDIVKNGSGGVKVENIASSSSQGYVLNIPSPSQSPTLEDQSIKVEPPEINLITLEQESTTMEGSLLNFRTNKFETFASDEVASMETETIDFKNFLHLDVEEVLELDEWDDNNVTTEAVTVSNASTASDVFIVPPKKPRVCICLICNMGFPTQVTFMQHMANEHKDTHPFACRNCGKRFKQKDQRNKHELIHDSNRYEGEPQFACDKCDQKYHLKASLETHRKVKHNGYVKPKTRTNHPITQHRAIGVGRKRAKVPRGSHECTYCGLKFDFNCHLKEHEARVHTRIRPYKCDICEKGFFNASGLNWHIKQVHEKIVRTRYPASKSLKIKYEKQKSNTKRYPCGLCPRTFAKPCQLEEHHMVHTGEKPHVCGHCGRGFRLRKSLNAHSITHEKSRSQGNDNTYKCCVCGRQDFIRPNELHRHRLSSHKDIPYDRKKERAFGCGVCRRPYFLRSQAMVCAVLGHDPKQLQEAMFKHKCPECPDERLGYHSFGSIRNHWLDEHPDKPVPGKFLPNSENYSEALPYIIINQEKAAEIKEKGATDTYDFPLVVEFDLLSPEINDPPDSPPPPVLVRQPECRPTPSSILPEEEFFLSTEITRSQALEAVKAVVSSGSSRISKLRSSSRKIPLASSSPKKSTPTKQTQVNLHDSLIADRALGNKRIARVLERIRTARARKTAIKESIQNKDNADCGNNNTNYKFRERIKR